MDEAQPAAGVFDRARPSGAEQDMPETAIGHRVDNRVHNALQRSRAARFTAAFGATRIRRRRNGMTVETNVRQVARPRPTALDRFLLVLLASKARSWRSALLIVQPPPGGIDLQERVLDEAAARHATQMIKRRISATGVPSQPLPLT